MKKHYRWLLFDADGTLFDYARAETTSLRNTFRLLSLPFEEKHLDVYQRINHDLWQAFERNEVTQDALRVRRFEMLLESLQLSGSPDQMSTIYVEQLGLCTHLIEGAYELLQTLHTKSRLAIVTNGLESVQRSRFARSTIRHFISELIISEEIGAAKPQAAFFDITFSRLGHPPREDVLIIGDSLSSDIKGGLDYGIDTCWFNPMRAPRPDDLPITYEIRHLRELLDVLSWGGQVV